MLSHVHIGVREFDDALALYSAVLAGLGWTLKFVERERLWAGWKPDQVDRPLFLIGRPYDGAPARRQGLYNGLGSRCDGRRRPGPQAAISSELLRRVCA